MKRTGIYYVGGQDDYMARTLAAYDILCVTPGNTQANIDWLNSIRAYNPAIKILCYNVIAEESSQTTIGPAVEHMKSIMFGTVLNFPFIDKGSGVAATYNNGITTVRLWDYTKPVFATAWKTGVKKLFDWYPYDGIMIDNCTCSLGAQQQGNFNKANATSALQTIISDVKAAYPTKLFIGNTSEYYKDLDGVLVEAVNLTDIQTVQRLPQLTKPGTNIFTIRADRAATYFPIIDALGASLCVI